MPPQVEISGASEVTALHRSATRTFTAVVVDTEIQRMSFAWGQHQGVCQPPIDTSMPSQGPSRADTYSFRGDGATVGPHCVWVLVTDGQGARGVAYTTVFIENQAPDVQLSLIAPMPSGPVALGSLIQVKITASDPDKSDTVETTVGLTSPTGEQPAISACSDDETLWCFRAMNPGTWKVTALARDDAGMASTAELDVIVNEDQPPCATGTPASAIVVHDPAQPLLLEVRVDDDLDSVPAADGLVPMAKFRWQIWDEASADWLTALDHAERTFRVPANGFRPADIVRVRVDVADRIARPALLKGCPANDDVCAVAPGCHQRLTWNVEFR